MNYLAHIDLAEHSKTSLLGNFLGDFVKGSNLSDFSKELEIGIRLHRKIDVYTDNHPTIKLISSFFPTYIRRTAGIAIDVYFDHLLIKNWARYSELPLNCLLDKFYILLENSNLEYSERFQKVQQGLSEYKWLNNYATVDGVHAALLSIERRFKRSRTFADSSVICLENHSALIEKHFHIFYPELRDFSQKTALQLRKKY